MAVFAYFNWGSFMKTKKATKQPKQTHLKLPYKQELFCRYFIETCGNKLKSALLAFDIKDRELGLKYCENVYLEEADKQRAFQVYHIAGGMGAEYYNKPKVKQRIDELISTEYFTDASVQREHTKLILQDGDLSTKKGGVEMYYKLRGKFAPEKVETKHIIDLPDYKNLSQEELKKLEAEVMKQIL